jgi:hypothetical protein
MNSTTHPLASTHLSQDSMHRLLAWCFIYAATHPQELDPDKWRDLTTRKP